MPDRELLIESICRIVWNRAESGLVFELCCGDGSLSEAILVPLERIRILALDASDIMLRACARRTESCGDRIEIRAFGAAVTACRQFPEASRAIISTFAIQLPT